MHKKSIKILVRKYFWIILFGLFLLGSAILDFGPGQKIYGNFRQFFLEMIAFLPLMFILVGLFDVWVPKEKIEKHIGHESGVMGTFWVILLATLQAGPLYGAFPVAHLLFKKGASVRNIFVYLGAFSCLKIPLVTFEIGFLGLKFSLLRTFFSLPVFIVIAAIMEKLLKNKNFEIKNAGVKD